jgi:hypothetical protein
MLDRVAVLFGGKPPCRWPILQSSSLQSRMLRLATGRSFLISLAELFTLDGCPTYFGLTGLQILLDFNERRVKPT